MAYKGRFQKRRRRRVRLLPMVVVCLLLAVVGTVGNTIGKYTKSVETPLRPAVASKMYFNSDLLGDEANPPEYSQVADNMEEVPITFTLRNYSGSKSTSQPITFEVFTKFANGQETRHGEPYTLSGKGASKPIELTVNMTSANKVYVIVRTTAPYVTELWGVFNVDQVTSTNSLTVSNSNGPTALVTLTMGSVPKRVTITAPAGYYADPTNWVAGKELTISGSSITFNASANATYTFTFLKTNPSDVSTDFSPKYENIS